MFGKNNKKMRDLEQREKVTYYGIRKFTVGVVSVAISAAFLLSGQTRYVLADEQPAIESRNNKQLVISKQEHADDGVNSKALASKQLIHNWSLDKQIKFHLEHKSKKLHMLRKSIQIKRNQQRSKQIVLPIKRRLINLKRMKKVAPQKG
ncbi:YSIRK-type signal peptide-containing protein [Lactobacillus iners]|nr:YSIRK-type signal peptide-containing protein [Lactobacillus iners]MDK7883029.1 YSIRK-type signal peptide-containing protein [Lactobacillus iners]